MTVYPGSYREYLGLRDETAAPEVNELDEEQTAAHEPEIPSAQEAMEVVIESAAPRVGWSRTARRRDERRRRQIEAALEDVEYWLAQATEALEAARAANDESEIMVLEAETAEAREQLEALMAEWELLS